jgi:hypothetical protein
MAERGSWNSIRQHGLLSTSALLDLYEVADPKREAIEARRRPENVAISHPALGTAVVRDQKPMDDAGLTRCLQDGLTPSDWYCLLNSRVFFWLSKNRLLRLLGAGAYKDKAHDVLELDAMPLVTAYCPKITLSPMNSGCTKPLPHPRGLNTFLPIKDYPYDFWRRRRPKWDRAAELVVERGVPDAHRYVRRVLVMRRDEILSTIWER